MKYVTHKKRSNGEGSVFFTTTRCFEFLVPEYTMYVCEGGKRESIDSNCVRVCVCVCTYTTTYLLVVVWFVCVCVCAAAAC